MGYNLYFLFHPLYLAEKALIKGECWKVRLPLQKKHLHSTNYLVLSSRTGPDMPIRGTPPQGEIRTYRVLKLFSVDMTNSEIFLCFVFEMQIIMGSHSGCQNLKGQLCTSVFTTLYNYLAPAWPQLRLH